MSEGSLYDGRSSSLSPRFVALCTNGSLGRPTQKMFKFCLWKCSFWCICSNYQQLQQLPHKLHKFALASGSLRLGQSGAAAVRRPEASHDRTCGSGFHIRSGGPTETTSDAMAVRSSSQIRLIRLTPLSHSAVLTGSVSTRLTVCSTA